MDDFDILGAIKVWQFCDDKVLAELSKRLINRDLFKIEISKNPFSENQLAKVKKDVQDSMQLNSEEEVDYFVYTDILRNNAYNEGRENINLLMKNGDVIDLAEASDNLNISALTKPVEKYFLCYPITSS